MKTITCLKDFTASNAKILVEFRNKKCIMGITSQNGIYITSFYNIETKHEYHKCFLNLKKALDMMNNWMNIINIDNNYTQI